MGDTAPERIPTLAEQWSLPTNEEKPIQSEVPVAPAHDENPNTVNSEEVKEENNEEASSEEKTDDAPAAEENTEIPEEEQSVEEADEEKPAIKIETAPADFRFPTTNQTRHCFTRYIEYHRCIQAKGDEAEECNKFAKYYRSLCPNEWIERWNEQRENGTFPGPL